MTCCPSCVSFDRSLSILNLDNIDGAYGWVVVATQCNINWTSQQREGWQRFLCIAHSEIQRDLNRVLCTQQVNNETHYLKKQLTLRQHPIEYLGKPVYSEWQEASLEDDLIDEQFFVICASELELVSPGATIDDVKFSWPDDVLTCYPGDSCFQEPCITEMADCGLGEPGWRISWPYRQLVSPTVDSASLVAELIAEVKWRVETIDTSLAVEAVGECSCYVCNGGTPTFTAEIIDAHEGIICINRGNCVNLASRVRINYGAEGVFDPAIEQAIVLLALLRSQNSNVKPCGCDNTGIENYLKDDPTAASEFATKLTYGPTVAGMTVMRILHKYEERPIFNTTVQTGGMIGANNLTLERKRIRYLNRFG